VIFAYAGRFRKEIGGNITGEKMRRSERGRLIKKIEALIFKQLLKERGARCEICGRTKGLGLFHILPKSTYPRLRFCKENLLIVCWYPCHYNWHHDYYKAKKIEQRIIKLRGKDYLERLKALNLMTPKLSMFYLRTLYEALKTEF